MDVTTKSHIFLSSLEESCTTVTYIFSTLLISWRRYLKVKVETNTKLVMLKIKEG